ncbi:hypothetical protein ACFFJY_12355 [Fictibacillus aquaticus]|uniref:Uncharacterized protein n=1 Tax=Fictibacillus aquaticus TaxID=2021314 RepID=A0A235FDN3_9BACL|nr:hypothetical protein [Fictibacillus aquaticus]OYD59034.1 hypothetical protein CGZ90_03790 [Fictibacillus aquaticus]
MGNNHKHIPKAANSLQDECIRVQKVYDWVTDSLTVRKSVAFSSEQIKKIEKAMDDPCRRPLRIVTKVPKTPPVFPLSESESENHSSHFLCEQVGEKRNVTVSLNGGFAEAQLVDLLFTTDVKVQVVDRNGDVVTELLVNASVFESFVLCYPDGTDLYCRITKIIARIPTGTVLLNSPAPLTFEVEITFCVDIQVEAEVKLEVLAKFCSPRENDLVAPEDVASMCDPITFPPQCPDIYPRAGCDCSAKGEASGLTGENSTESGRLAILVDVCPNCSINNSSFRLSFNDTDTSDGQSDFDFTAVSFDQDTLCCDKYNGGLRLTISGTGRVSTTGELYDFNLAVVQTNEGNQFQVQLINAEGVTVFESGIVTADAGEIELQDCVSSGH